MKSAVAEDGPRDWPLESIAMHEQPAARWSDTPLAEWIEYGCERLAQFGIDDDDYRHGKLRGRILDSIAWAFWDSLRRTAEADTTLPRKGREKYVEQTICRLLGLHRAQADRWSQKRICPNADSFFGTLVLVLKKEIEEAGFPRNRDVAWVSSLRTLDLIRRDDCRLGRLRIEPEEQSCLWFFVRHPDSASLAGPRRVPAAEESDSLVRVYAHVLRQVARQHPSGKIRTARMLRNVIEAWLDPFTMFLAGLIPGWELIDVPAAGR